MSFPAKVAFRAPNGQYFRAEGGGGQVVGATGPSIGPSETFVVIDRGNGEIALQVSNGMYVSVPFVGSAVMANATAITAAELFTVIDRGGGQVALRTQSGMYLRADSVSTVVVMANATTIGPTETFEMLEQGTQMAPRFGAYDYSAPLSLSAPGRGAVSFTVTAQSNVYVGISSFPGSGSQMYEIVFAGPGGASVLRRGAQGPVLASSGGNLLTPGTSTQLWVAIDATTQTIQAGRGAVGQDPIFTFRDPQFLTAAQFVAFSCWDTPISLGSVQTQQVMMAALLTDSPPTAVHLGNPPKLNIQNCISIAAWVFPTATDGFRNIVARGYQPSPQGEVFLRINNGSYQLGSADSAGEHKVSVAMPAGDLGTWVHLAGVYNGSKWSLYRNGVCIGEVVDPIGAVPVNGGWSIGTRGDFLERSFRGRVCAVSIWNSAIDATLIQACMACSLIGFEPGLVGYWPLDEGTGTVVLDKTAAPANGTVVQALWTLGAGPSLPAAPPVVAPPPPQISTPFQQGKWNRCRKCQGIFYGPSAGVCPQGGAHDGTGSWDYQMFAYSRPDGQGQRKWYWCRKCAGLFYYSGVGSTGTCSAGNTHDYTGSAEYLLVTQEPSSIPAQPGWVWCSKCQLLSYSGEATSICPAGGAHATGGSAAYVVRYEVPTGTTTVTVQPSTGLPPPSGDPTIDTQLATLAQTGVPLSIFGVPFSMPLRFSGSLQTTFTADSAEISGSAHLDSPFSTDLGLLTMKLSRTAGASAAYLRFDLPLSLSTIVQNQVQPRVPAEAWTAIDLLAMPMVRGFDAPTVVLSPIAGTDPSLPGPIVKGINFYKSIVLSSVEPFTLLNSTFPMLHLEQRTIGAHLGISSDNGALNWQVGLALVLNQPLGTELVVFKSISMMVKPGLATLQAGVKALLTVRVSDSETLNITGGVNLKQTAVGASMTLWGALDAADGAWRDPLGLKGLTINGLGIEIGASTVFPNIVLGFRGDVMLGSSALHAVLAFYFDPADVGATILQISSPEGIGLLTILKALLAPVLSPPSFFDIAVTDLNFYIAPKGGSIAGKSYAKGTQLSGKLNLFGYHAAVDGRIDYSSGASLHGTMDRISLKAGNITFLELTDATGSGNPTISVDANTQKQGIHISGRLRVFNDFYRQDFEADVGSSGVLITLSSSAGGIFASTLVKLDRSGFALSMAPCFNFGFSLFGVDLSVGIEAKIDIAINDSAFSQTIGFKFRAFGATMNAGSVTLSVPICTIDELRSVFEQFADIIKDFFRNKLVAGLETAVAWLRDNLTLAVSEAGQLLRSAGVAMAEAAKALVSVMGAAVKDAALAVARTLDEAVSLLRDTFGLPAQEIADFANSVGNVFTSGIGSVGSMFSGGSNSLYVPPGGFTVIKDYYHGNHQWLFDSPGSGAISFSVRNAPAAKVAFSPTPTLSDPMYELEIGMEEDSKIYLRKARGGAVIASGPGGMTTSGDRLWVGIDNGRAPGLIQVGRGEVGSNVLFSFSDPAFIANAQYVLLGRSNGTFGLANELGYWDMKASPVETRLAFSSSPATAVQLGNPPKLDIRGAITISAWIRPLATDGLRNIVARGYVLSPSGEVFLRIYNGEYQLGSWGNGTHMLSVPIPSADLGRWVHLTGTYDGQAWVLYHNGYFMARVVAPVGAIPVSGGWAIGSTGDRSERCFVGNIAEVTIWNKAIDMATIDTLIQGTVTTPTPGLVGYWPLGKGCDTRDMFGGLFNSSFVGHTMNVGPQTSLGGQLGGSTLVPADGTLVGASWTLSPPIPKLAAPAVTNATNQAFTHLPLVTKSSFPWTGLGGALVGNPSIVSWGPGRLDVFSRGTNNALFHTWFDGVWHDWESLGGVFTGDPSACSRGANLLDVYVRGMANDICIRWWDGGSWQGYASLGGSMAGSPVGLGRTGHRDFFALGTDKAIWRRYEDATWSPLVTLGGGLLDPPAVVYGNGRYDVFARGLNNAVFQCTSVGNAFSPWTSLGGALMGPPTAVATASGSFVLFGRGTDQRIWTRSVGLQSTSDWVSLAVPSGPDPGAALTDPVAICSSPSRVDLLVIGADQALWHRRRLNGVWQSWRKLGALRVLSKPAVTSSAPGRLDIAVYSTDGTLWHYRMDD